jgi:hygromycin-B 7''-O-kinase
MALQRVVDPHHVLRAAGLEDDGFTPRHGWSNRAWVGRRFVVRISSGRLEGSFEHEGRVSTELRAAGVPAAPVLANGLVADLPGSQGEAGEWIVTERLAGDTLAAVWSDLDDASRSKLGRSLGEVMRNLHQVDIGDVAPRWWLDAHQAPLLRNAYRPRVELGPVMVRAARDLDDADHALLDDVEAMLDERLPLFEDDVPVLVHGDVHGHNVLVDGRGDLVALLDWEGAHKAAADQELDMLLRWAAAAHDFPESPGLPSRIAAGDCVRLVEDVATAYPALVAVPRLSERLEVYDAHWHLVQLLFDAYWNANTEVSASSTSSSWTRLKNLIDGRSHIGTFGL